VKLGEGRIGFDAMYGVIEDRLHGRMGM